MGLSGWHIILVIVIILVFFGPSRLPGLGKSVGEAIRGFKKGIDGDEIDVTTRKQEQIHPPGSDNITQQKQTDKKSDPHNS